MNEGHWSCFKAGSDEVLADIESSSLTDLFRWIKEENLQHDGDSEVIVISDVEVLEAYVKDNGDAMAFRWRITYNDTV